MRTLLHEQRASIIDSPSTVMLVEPSIEPSIEAEQEDLSDIQYTSEEDGNEELDVNVAYCK